MSTIIRNLHNNDIKDESLDTMESNKDNNQTEENFEDKEEIVPDLNQLEDHPKIVDATEIQEQYIDNKYILRGYRVGFNTVGRILKSLFLIHNETFNIWSHLTGCIYALVLLVITICSLSNPELFHLFSKATGFGVINIERNQQHETNHSINESKNLNENGNNFKTYENLNLKVKDEHETQINKEIMIHLNNENEIKYSSIYNHLDELSNINNLISNESINLIKSSIDKANLELEFSNVMAEM